jgi:hypothetical protein
MKDLHLYLCFNLFLFINFVSSHYDQTPPLWEFIDKNNRYHNKNVSKKIERNCVLISGVLHRFVFRDSRIGRLQPYTDVFIQLQNDSNAVTWNKGKIDSPNYESTSNAIQQYFLDLGAESVHINIYSKEDINSIRHNLKIDVGVDRINSLSGDSIVRQWIPHAIMFLLRHFAYRNSLNFANKNEFSYTSFLYQREDNVYVTKELMRLPEKSLQGIDMYICI